MILKESVAKQQFSLHAYCLMPDHIHILAEGMDEQSNLLKLVKLFKQRTAFNFRHETTTPFWENRFHEHILRSSDGVENVASYIWLNPIRKGLSASPLEYPLSGSQTIEWMSKIHVGTVWTPPWKAREAGL